MNVHWWGNLHFGWQGKCYRCELWCVIIFIRAVWSLFDSFSSKLCSYWSWNVSRNELFWQTLKGKKAETLTFDNWFIFSWLELLVLAIGILYIICTKKLHFSFCSSCPNPLFCSKTSLSKTLSFLEDVPQTILKVFKSFTSACDLFIFSGFFWLGTKINVQCSILK